MSSLPSDCEAREESETRTVTTPRRIKSRWQLLEVLRLVHKQCNSYHLCCIDYPSLSDFFLGNAWRILCQQARLKDFWNDFWVYTSGATTISFFKNHTSIVHQCLSFLRRGKQEENVPRRGHKCRYSVGLNPKKARRLATSTHSARLHRANHRGYTTSSSIIIMSLFEAAAVSHGFQVWLGSNVILKGGCWRKRENVR